MKKIERLADIAEQRRNANLHTPRGMGALQESIQKDGWIGALTVAADGEAFDGSARVEIGNRAGFEDAIIVQSDGSKPLIHVRTDIPHADDERAVRLGLAANRVASLNLDLDASLLKTLSEKIDLTALWTEEELEKALRPLEQEGQVADQSSLLQEHFNILIECTNEREQRELLQRLTEEGVPCRSLIS